MYHRMEAGDQIQKLIQKIKRLFQELTGFLSHAELRKILGVPAVLFGISISTNADAQSFASPVANPFGLQTTKLLAVPAFADLDGDGDQDLLVGEYEGVLKYFQNTGTSLNPQFAAPQVNPFGLVSTYNVSVPAFADLDGDGDMDLLVGEYYGAMQYFQNTGSMSNPQFAAPVTNPFGLTSTYSLAAPAFADLDDDGDLDLLVGEYEGSMKYFLNSGSALSPQFEPPWTNPFGLVSTYYYAFPAFADLDDDGDLDLLVGEYYGVMKYFQNVSTGIGDLPPTFSIKLFPNPVSDILKIETDEIIRKIEIFNSLGERVIMLEYQENQVSLNHLIPGVYLVKVTSDTGNFTTAKIQKQ